MGRERNADKIKNHMNQSLFLEKVFFMRMLSINTFLLQLLKQEKIYSCIANT